MSRVGLVEEVDQWTIGLRAELPLQKYTAADGLNSEIYVSPSRARVILHTTSRDRLLAWLGAIPHWLYFLPLRSDSSLWSQVVIAFASTGVLFVILGLGLLFTQVRWRRLPDIRCAIPYRGMLRWHTILGIGFGWCVLTWTFSGLLSMEPYAWTRARGLDFNSELYYRPDIDLGAFDSTGQLAEVAANGTMLKEVQFRAFAGTPFLELRYEAPDKSAISREFLAAESGQPLRLFSATEILAQLQAAVPGTIVESAVLSDYDHYYYGRKSGQSAAPPLPVLRVEFDDPARTRYYVDLQTGGLVYLSHSGNRLERWLYRGLHSLDFKFLYSFRPLWDVVVWILLTGGLALSVLGAYLGFKRLARGLRPS